MTKSYKDRRKSDNENTLEGKITLPEDFDGDQLI